MNLIIKKDKVHYESPAVHRRTAPAHTHERGARLVTIAGVARAIEVSCECGETFVIELEFEGDKV